MSSSRYVDAVTGEELEWQSKWNAYLWKAPDAYLFKGALGKSPYETIDFWIARGQIREAGEGGVIDAEAIKAECENEHQRRLYYQNIVYDVCNILDTYMGHTVGAGIVCGSVDEPNTEVQDALKNALNIEAVEAGDECVKKHKPTPAPPRMVVRSYPVVWDDSGPQAFPVVDMDGERELLHIVALWRGFIDFTCVSPTGDQHESNLPTQCARWMRLEWDVEARIEMPQQGE